MRANSRSPAPRRDAAMRHLPLPVAASPPEPSAIHKEVGAHVIYGAFHLLAGYYVAVVTQTKRACEGPHGSVVNQVREMAWLPVRWRDAHHAAASVRADDAV
jgi:hypothetical protein